MAAGDREFAELRGALGSHSPTCDGDRRFISDELSERDRFEMRGMCRECQVLDLCGAYAAAVRPTGGFWAGKQRQGRSGR